MSALWLFTRIKEPTYEELESVVIRSSSIRSASLIFVKEYQLNPEDFDITLVSHNGKAGIVIENKRSA